MNYLRVPVGLYNVLSESSSFLNAGHVSAYFSIVGEEQHDYALWKGQLMQDL